MRNESRLSLQLLRAVLLLAVTGIFLLATWYEYLGHFARKVTFVPGWMIVDDLILGIPHNTYDSILRWRFLVSWLFWIALLWVILQFIYGKYARAILALASLTALFGWLSFRVNTGGPYTFHRHWGHVTYLAADHNEDGQIDGESWFSWSEPLMGKDAHAIRERCDCDHDGQWDTWFDHEAHIVRIDTNGDGSFDLTVPANGWGRDRTRQLRGFDW